MSRDRHVNDADPNTPITVRIRDDTGSLLAALYLSPEGAEGLHAELDAALLELDPNWHRHLAEKSEG